MENLSRTAEEMSADPREKQIVDLRREWDYMMSHYPGAVNHYWENTPDFKAIVCKDNPVYLICYTGATSMEIAEELSAAGYEAYSIEDGQRGVLRWQIANE